MTVSVGTLDMNDDRAKATFRRLSLAKQMFLHGIGHSEKTGQLNKMIAIHNLHNAVEIVIRAIFLHFEIRAERELNIGFESMLNEVDKHFREEGIKLPYRREMRNLNEARNLVQHHAVEPSSSVTEESRVFVRRFLIRAYQTYFGCDFETVTWVSMVEDEYLRKLLDSAAEDIAVGDLKKALASIDASFHWANASIGEVLPEPGIIDRFDELHDFGHRLEGILDRIKDTDGFPRHIRMSRSTDSFPELGRFERRLGDSLRYLHRRSAYYAALLASGVDIVEYKRFKDCTVPTRFSGSTQVSSSGKKTSRSINIHWGDKEPTEEDAVWAHTFAVNTIVQWQILGLSPKVPDGNVSKVERLLAWGDDIVIT